MKRKLVSLLLFPLIFLVGCSSSEVNETVLTVATNAYFKPYEYYEGEQMVGIDIDIIHEIGNRLGKDVHIEDMDFENLLTAVNTGKVDCVIAGMTVTDERKELVSFTDTYTTSVQSVIVKSDSNIVTIDDLKEKQIGVQKGTTGNIYALDDFENVQEYSKLFELVDALSNSKIDAIIIDNAPACTVVQENLGFKLLDTDYANENYAIAVGKNNKELLNSINEILVEMKKDGTLDSIISSYIK